MKHLVLACLGATLMGAGAHAEDPVFKLTGSARFRSEFKNDADFKDSTGDYTAGTHTRVRLDFNFHPNDRVQVFVQPQFTKTWGAQRYEGSSAAANTATDTSGSTFDSPVTFHQAHVQYKAMDDLSFTIGRKELSYGDQLLVGPLNWNAVGRAFDLALGNYKYAFGSVDLFSAKVRDLNSAAAGAGDRDFSGFYSANNFGENFQNADLYAFLSEDATGATRLSTTAYGLRLKSPIAAFDYRAEVTFENVKGAAKTSDENQFDVEAGYVVWPERKLRLAAEYFQATENFDQLYPTGHKWLGYADLLSRRNIQGFRAGVSSQVTEQMNVSLDYHNFSRQSTSAPAYKLSGAAYGAAGTESAVGDEWDLVASYKLPGDVSLEGGAARFSPAGYLKTNSGSDPCSFYYVQMTVGF